MGVKCAELGLCRPVSRFLCGLFSRARARSFLAGACLCLRACAALSTRLTLAARVGALSAGASLCLGACAALGARLAFAARALLEELARWELLVLRFVIDIVILLVGDEIGHKGPDEVEEHVKAPQCSRYEQHYVPEMGEAVQDSVQRHGGRGHQLKDPAEDPEDGIENA